MTALALTHIGGPTTLLEFDGWRILTDPTFDGPGATYRFGVGTSSRKTAGPALGVDELGPVDAVLLTHDQHADNLDDAGRRLLPAAGVVLTTVTAAHRLGANAKGLDDWQTTRLEHPDRPPLDITATPCRHGPAGSRRIVGDVIGFALRWTGQLHGAVWISGDTVLYDGVRQVAERLTVGTAIVHLGAVRFRITGPLTYTMDIADALELCRQLDPHTIVPVHYEGWSHFSQGRDAIEQHLRAHPGPIAQRVTWLVSGQPVELDA